MMDYFIIIMVILAFIIFVYLSYQVGYVIGYYKCQDKYEDYLDNRGKKVYNSSNDSNS